MSSSDQIAATSPLDANAPNNNNNNNNNNGTDNNGGKIPAVGIDVRSIARFVRQFDVAANIVSRTHGESRITFVLMFAVPQTRDATALLYAIRLFKGREADDVSNILDHVYRVRDHTDAASTVQAQVERLLRHHWLAAFPAAEFPPRFPHVYSFFFNPEAYRDDAVEQRIQQLRAHPNLDRDLNSKQPASATLTKRPGGAAAEGCAAHSENRPHASTVPAPHDDDDDDDDDDNDGVTVDDRDEEEALRRMANSPPGHEDASSSQPLTELDRSNLTLRDIMFAAAAADDKDDGVPISPSSRPNRVDAEGFAEWLLQRSASDPDDAPHRDLDAWIEAHHRVDRVLFDRARLRRMFDRLRDTNSPMWLGLPLLSRLWTLPFLRVLQARKLNDILALKTDRPLMYTHVAYDRGLDVERIARDFTVPSEQCRSRRGFNIVLPIEWIESSVVPWDRVYEAFCQHVARPNDQFLLLQLYRHTHPVARRTTLEHFFVNVRCLQQPPPATNSRGRDLVSSAAVRSVAASRQQFFTDLFRPPPPPPPPSSLPSSPASASRPYENPAFARLLSPSLDAPPSILPPFAPVQFPPPPRAADSLVQQRGTDAPSPTQHYFRVGGRFYGRDPRADSIATQWIRFVSSFRHVPPRQKHHSTFLLTGERPLGPEHPRSTGGRSAAPRRSQDGGALLDLLDGRPPPPQPSSPTTTDHRSTAHLLCDKFDHWEQALLLDFGLRFLDADHSINVNGDPGTGKSTVLWYLLQLFARPLCAVPTNKMKHQFAMKLEALTRAGFYDYSVASVQTTSACLKRLGGFHMSPADYSKVVVRCFTDCVTRLRRMLRSRKSRYDHELFNIGLDHGVSDSRRLQRLLPAVNRPARPTTTPTATAASARAKRCSYVGPNVPAALKNHFFRSPDVLFLDESNMCTWQHLAFLHTGLRTLRCALMMFGDSGQNRPIHADPDNPDLIAFSSGGLTVQMLTNKRLAATSLHTPIARVLDDNVWRLIAADNNLPANVSIGAYVRSLLRRNFAPDGLVDRLELDITGSVAEWCERIVRLDEFYATAGPCLRYVYTRDDAARVARAVPRPPQWFLIALTNRACDRFNFWYLTAFHRELARRFAELGRPPHRRQLYSLGLVRQCYIPRAQLPHIPGQQIRYDEPTYHPDRDAYLSVLASQIPRAEHQRIIRGDILDDPWTAPLRLCVGFLYVYLGSAACIPPCAVLRLIAIVPDIEKNRQFLCQRPQCRQCQQIYRDVPRSVIDATSNPLTAGTSVAGLLMELTDRPSSGATRPTEQGTDHRGDEADGHDPDANTGGGGGTFFIVTQEYYQMSRYNSLWCESRYRPSPRGDSRFYGYPLRLHSSLTSYKVQGETLYRELYPSVCLDLDQMGREATLVALSRLTDHTQLRSIANVDRCCRQPETTRTTSDGRGEDSRGSSRLRRSADQQQPQRRPSIARWLDRLLDGGGNNNDDDDDDDGSVSRDPTRGVKRKFSG